MIIEISTVNNRYYVMSLWEVNKMTKTVNVLVRLDNDLVKFISDYILDDDEDLCEFVADCVEEKIQTLIDDHCFSLEEFVSILSSIIPVVENEDEYGN